MPNEPVRETPSGPADRARLWEAHAAGNAAARARLIEDNLGLVRHVARQLWRTLATTVEFDELVSAGTIGLMAALDGFDARRGHAFSTFAAPRIRGAILDELRRLDHVPRSVRRKSRAIARARETLSRTAGRPAAGREIAEQLGVDEATLRRWQTDAEGVHQVPLDRPADGRDPADRVRADVLADEDHERADDRLSREQEAGRLREAILGLREQERLVLSLYYFEELKLHEIAAILRITESRASQVRTKALSRLRRELCRLRDQVA